MTTQQFDQGKAETLAEQPVDAPNSDAVARARGGKVETITSKDGTQIAYRRSGEGPPLVLVHGAASDRGRWSPVLLALEERFTVYAIDRRGRGGSGDADSYAIEREYEDVASMVDSLGEPVNLLGHSYGALCARGRSAHPERPQVGALRSRDRGGGSGDLSARGHRPARGAAR